MARGKRRITITGSADAAANGYSIYIGGLELGPTRVLIGHGSPGEHAARDAIREARQSLDSAMRQLKMLESRLGMKPAGR
jgi:hypothetical protein